MVSEGSKSIHDIIYRALRLQIMLGQIERGKSLSIRGLATL